MAMLGHPVAALAVFLLFCALLVGRLHDDASRGSCDTTWLYEGYETVTLPPELAGFHHARYRLIRFADRDPALAIGVTYDSGNRFMRCGGLTAQWGHVSD